MPVVSSPSYTAVAPVVSSPSYTAVARRNKTYRGGFHSSICGLFADPSRRADCCALACCGILLSDRNRYLLDGERPVWWKRIAINVVIPIAALALMIVLGAFVFDKDSDLAESWGLITFLVVVASVGALCVRGRLIRMRLRREIMNRMYQERNESDEPERHKDGDICCAQVTCCGCYHNDVTYRLVDDLGDGDGDNEEDPEPDFCTCLFQNLGSLCCGMCCQCWCQFFGMCAIGQEEHEISSLVPKNQQLIDYVTFEPFLEYYPRIVELRNNVTESFWAHLQAISKLSKKLLITLALCLLLLTVLALTRVDKQFQFINLLVLIATFLQAFVILHFVHWRWHRFDLSFDAVIKFFSSGFLLATTMAMAYEWVIKFAFDIAFYIIIAFDIIIENPEGQSGDDPKIWVAAYLHSHVWLFAILAFFNAFVVAALTEELCKYFAFWMVEHPDFMDDKDWNAVTADESTGESESKVDGKAPQHNVRALAEGANEKTLKSKGAAITIGLVTASLGFACCENLMYIFTGKRGASIFMEAETLLLRSFLPVHPIAAVIQSIGVCRRDLEGDKSFSLGRIILPAVLLHGTFDFILMVVAVIIGTRHIDEELDPNNSEIKETPADIRLDYISVACGFAMVLLGIVYYVQESRSQKKRLQDLEQTNSQHDGTDIPLVV